MAKTTKTAKSEYDYRLVGLRLTAEHLAEFDRWLTTINITLPQAVMEVLSGGYKITQKYSDSQNLVYVSFVGNEEHPFNPKATLTSFSPEWEDAFWLNYYKALIIFEGDSWELDEADKRDARG